MTAPSAFPTALQDVCRLRTPLLVGLLAQLSPSPLQEDMAEYAWRVVNRGQSILSQLPRKRPTTTKRYATNPRDPPEQLVFSLRG